MDQTSLVSKDVLTNAAGLEDENIYEEINELERRLALEKVFSGNTSLVDEVLDEVERVRQRHDTVLNQLNLDFENFLNPHTLDTPPVSPLPDQLDGNEVSTSTTHLNTANVNEAINKAVNHTVKEPVKDNGNCFFRNRYIMKHIGYSSHASVN